MRNPKWFLAIVVMAVVAVVVVKYTGQGTEDKDQDKPTPRRVSVSTSVLTGADLAAVLKSGRPTMADFGKGWCIPCKMMAPVLKQAARELAGKANVVYVDMEKYPVLAQQHRITIMPTQIFFNARGEEVNRHIGFMPLTDIKAQLRSTGMSR
jgi:thioredoxin 1